MGSGSGGFSEPRPENDRNVFDPRDYKLAPLDAKPSLGKWKKWRRDIEAFIDTIGVGWKGTSGLLRELRRREGLFDSTQFQEAAAARGDKVPKVDGFDYDDKMDVLYRLVMPKLDEVLSNELAQTGEQDGFEMFRQLVRKLDPPKADVAFDFKAEIEGLESTSLATLL